MKHCIEILANRYPQIYMPIKKGIRETEEYKDVVLRGKETNRKITFSFNPNDKLEKIKTPIGEVEIITLYDRNDFEHMCLCLGNKCEPNIIPKSTGAMILLGLNNWEKVRQGLDDYKDSFIILSSGNYSNVNFIDVNKYCGYNLDEKLWSEKSIEIRKYHELTHFVMRKMYPDNIDFIRDELIADAIGLIKAFDKFDRKLLMLFLGLEENTYRKGGRLENYEGFDSNKINDYNKMIIDLENKINNLDSKDINYIWKNIEEVM